MEAKDTHLWFDDVIQPKLDVLRSWAQTLSFDEAEMKPFFREFLAELELVHLDDLAVENYIDLILDGARTLNTEPFASLDINLKEIASIAFLKNTFDRALFAGYWRHYRPLIQKHSDIKDSSILNAYLLPRHLMNLVAYIERAKDADPLDLAVGE